MGLFIPRHMHYALLRAGLSIMQCTRMFFEIVQLSQLNILKFLSLIPSAIGQDASRL